MEDMEYIVLGLLMLLILSVPLSALWLFWNDGKELKDLEK